MDVKNIASKLLLRIVLFYFSYTESFSSDLLEDTTLSDESSSSELSLNLSDAIPSPPTSISFAGGVYIACTYELGVLKYLQEQFDLSNTSFLADSAGSFPAFLGTLGVAAEHFLQAGLLKSLQEKTQLPHQGFARWGEIVAKNLFASIEKNHWQLVKERRIHEAVQGRLYFSITHVDGKGKKQFNIPFINKIISLPWLFRNALISSYRSDEDLLKTLLTSCHLPYVLDGNFFIRWRGNLCLDGGFTNHNPKLDDNTCCINPFLWRTLDFWTQHGCFTLPTKEQAVQSFQWGYQDAKANSDYFLKHGLLLKKPPLVPMLELPQHAIRFSSAPLSQESQPPTPFSIKQRQCFEENY